MAKQGEIMTELSLGLPSASPTMKKTNNKRVFSEINDNKDSTTSTTTTDDIRTTRNKAQVVGWPPVCSYRKKNNTYSVREKYVKISMDGAPYLRKIDLKVHGGYSDLIVALEELFGCSGRISKLDSANNSEYILIYADKEGDWILVGDVPWTMFTESCKRLRIMRRPEVARHPAEISLSW